MKKNIVLLITLTALMSLSASAQQLTLAWKSDTLLRVPESVLLDRKENILYVANINGKSDQKDGNGFISSMTPEGKIRDLKWVTGLDAPKGMALVKGKLYVADLTSVAVIDVSKAEVIKKIDIEGASFLNDVTASENGDVFVSDSATGKIHLVRNDKAELFFESADLKRVNGLLSLKNELYVADAGTGINYKLSKDKKLTKFAETAQGADGIVMIGKDGYIVSSWGGEVYFVSPEGKSTKMLDTKEQKLNSADIWYDEKKSIVFIPTFFGNSVMAYAFKK
jgi:DNA-binding beta-propeller fold protein YncE